MIARITINLAFYFTVAVCLSTGLPARGTTLAHWDFDHPEAVAGSSMPGNGAREDLDGDGAMDPDDFKGSVVDRSGNGNHLTAWSSRSLTWTASSFAGDFSMRAEGAESWAVTDSAYNPYVSEYDIEKAVPQEWTVEALFNPARLRAGEMQTVICRDGSGLNSSDSTHPAFQMQLFGNGGVGIGYVDASGTLHEVRAEHAALRPGCWYHVAAVSDGTSLTLYVNGMLLERVGLKSENTRLLADTDATRKPHAWAVGRGMRRQEHADFFFGAIDEVAISADALSPGSFVVPVPPLLGEVLNNLVRNGNFDEGKREWKDNVYRLKSSEDGIVSWSGSRQTGIWQDTGAVFEADTVYRMTVVARKESTITKAVVLNIVDMDNEFTKLADRSASFQGELTERGAPWEVLTTSVDTTDHPEVVGHRIGVALSAANGIQVDRISLVSGARMMERLDRGVVAVATKDGVYVGWRMFGTEPDSVGYNVYRDSVKINASPITDSTNLLDPEGDLESTYRVAAVIDEIEQTPSEPVAVWEHIFKEVSLQRPPEGVTPKGDAYSYSPGDCSVGDLDGDGQLEIVLKWGPSNGKDNSKHGYSGNTILDAYEMDGTQLWRIDLGINIRAGSHYTQLMVYDLDCDGRAEVVCKTADGTKDGEGTVLGDAEADWRTGGGYILEGPEYLSAFDGRTGAFIDTVDYLPPRGNVGAWGDGYGNRVDRFLGCVAYLDGQRPSVVMTRGQYTRVVLAAWDLVHGKLVKRWVFDSDERGNDAYHGQGNHNLSVADVDGDGRDEIIYGSCAIDDDGTGLYSTGLGHGDALHVSDMDPYRPGLELWMPHETAANGATYRDAGTGEIIWDHPNKGDVGRGVAAHVDANFPGYQLWSYAKGGVYNVEGEQISEHYSGKMMSFLVWWTGSLQREFLSSAGRGGAPVIERWTGENSTRLLSVYNLPTKYGTVCIGGTKATPNLSGDLLGDWREEMIFVSSDKTKLRIFTTTHLTKHRIYTLLHDPQYRQALVWQNCGYNQPPHPGFYIGAGMGAPPRPNIQYLNGPMRQEQQH